ncbi:MAG: flagellar biosynthesis anti-sigma factor FlgM [Armatimonadia bacterium]
MMRIETYNCSQMSRLEPMGQTGRTETGQRIERGGVETLSLSPLGSLLASAQQALRGLPAVREGRVREVGMMVSSGRYKADAESIAGAMVGAGSGSGEPSHNTTISHGTSEGAYLSE